MEKARKLYGEKGTEIQTSPLSEVFYLHSFARFLSEQQVLEERPEKVYLKSLQICEKEIPEHPERAATLMFAGRLDKRRKETIEAFQKITQAWQLFNKCLGEHVMTAQCLKEFADLLFFSGNKIELNRPLDKAPKGSRDDEKIGNGWS